MVLVELVPVEMIPDFDGLVEVWITLFGRSESNTVAELCQQFWDGDFKRGIARRAIFDVARSRFPIQLKPLIRLLRAMTGSGFLDTDPLSTADHWIEGGELGFFREACDGAVADYLDKLSTYSQVIPVNACTGANALYEKIPERYGSSSTSTGITYMNLRPIRLPGGQTLPAKSIGRLLSGDGGEFVVICWEYEHSGWAMLLEVLTDYVNRKRLYSGTSNSYRDVSFGRRGGNQPVTLRLGDIGVEMCDGSDEEVITDILDLVRSVIQDNPDLARDLVRTLESGDPAVAHTMTESQPPDLVQLTTMVLEEALSRSAGHGKAFPRTQLITSSISVLSALLTVPNISDRVWLYIRSAASLFGSDRTAGFASVALAAERVTGHYTMTLALLHLVQRLFHEASSSVLSVPAAKSHLQQVKEEVLLRAARFVHTEIWVEHMGWKYAQLADRFEIGRRVTSFYSQVLEQAPPALGDKPFTALSQAIADAWVHKATTSTISPLVTSVATAGSVFRILNASRRVGDARRLVYLLQSHLHLTQLVLNYKLKSSASSTPCLLEQAFCARVTGGAAFDSGRSKVDPIDVLASYVKTRDMDVRVPLEAMHVLYTLCSSFSSSQPSPPSIIGHLSDPEATVASLVQIIHHPYYDSALRIAVWHFIALAVDKELALASLFVAGQFRLPVHIKGKGKMIDDGKQDVQDTVGKRSAIDVARDRLATWRELRESNPPLLASVLRFLDVVWQHGLEHQAVLESLRKDPEFWDQMGSVAREDVGPSVDYKAQSYINHDDGDCSDLHVAVSENSYRAMIKSYALHIIGTDISIHLQLHGRQQTLEMPISYLKIEDVFKDQDQLNDLVCDSVASEYNPTLYDEFMEQVSVHFPKLTLEQIRSQIPVEEREFGDDFVFSTSLLRSRMPSFSFVGDPMEGCLSAKSIDLQVRSINLNLSLTHSQTTLIESVQYLLRQVVPFVRGDNVVRPIVLNIAAAVSRDISKEKRPGDMMATVHGARLSLLLSLIEVAWFSTTDKQDEIMSFIAIVNNVHSIILNEPLSPAKSLLGQFTVPFHRTLLQVIFFCAKHCRNLAGRPKTLNAEQRLTITSMFDATLNFIIDALQLVFDSARSRLDLELDRDMELLVAVFEQCTRPDINKSSIQWLTRCQETDIIKSSLELFVRIDLVGVSDLSLLRHRKQPLYSPHVLIFHVALAGVSLAAERFASEGVLAAYSNNSISPAISAGLIDVTLPELPGERSPAHRAYCSMLAIVAGVVLALGRHNHFFDAEASGFVQLYGDQITRALSWTIGDPITLPLIEEIEQIVHLFYSIAANTPSAANTNPTVTKVLRVFSNHALMLLQQLNYALTHPNHLTSLLEPVTADERAQIEKELRESPGTSFSSSETMDPMKRPLTTRLMYRLFKLSSSILFTLISISHADDVLMKDQEDWSLNEALVIPVSMLLSGQQFGTDSMLTAL
jgi:nuclear pore complex protein Nup188